MVRINLLPKEKKRAPAKTKEKFFIVVGIIIYIMIGFSYMNLEKKEKELTHKITKLKTELKKYSYIEKEIKKLKTKKETTKRRVKTLIKLIENNPILIQDIDIITKTIPRNKLFFEEISHKGNIIKIRGNSLDLKDVAYYIEKLEKTNRFKKITLSGIKSKKINNLTITNFSITIEKKQ